MRCRRVLQETGAPLVVLAGKGTCRDGFSGRDPGQDAECIPTRRRTVSSRNALRAAKGVIGVVAQICSTKPHAESARHEIPRSGKVCSLLLFFFFLFGLFVCLFPGVFCGPPDSSLEARISLRHTVTWSGQAANASVGMAGDTGRDFRDNLSFFSIPSLLLPLPAPWMWL